MEPPRITTATVFISNLGPGHDYSKASRWGAIRSITQGNYPIFKTDRLIEEITSVLTHSSPEDFLLLSGSSVVAGMATAVWLTFHPRCKLLLFDRKAPDGGSYVLRVVARDQIKLSIERHRDIQEIASRKLRAEG